MVKNRKIQGIMGVWNEYKKSWLGLSGLFMLIFFVTIAVLAPYIAPYDPNPLNRVHPPFCAPSWTSIFDKDAFPTQQLVSDPDFKEDQKWFFYTNCEGYFRGQINHSLDSDTYVISFVDTDEVHSFREVYAYVETYFNWSYTRAPADVEINYLIKIDSTGDYKFGDYDIYVALAPKNYTKEWFLKYTRELLKENIIIYPKDIRDFGIVVGKISSKEAYWRPVKLDLNLLPILALFRFDQLSLRFVLFIKEVKVVSEGTINVHLDRAELTAYSNYFGILGTSDSGADVFSQLIWGARISLLIGVVSTLISVAIGVFVGLFSGYFGGLIDEIFMRIVDFLLIIPTLPLMMVLAAMLQKSIWSIISVLAIFLWLGTARLIRSQVLTEKSKAYVEAARISGGSDFYIIFRHILPNVLPLIFVQIASGVSGAILSEAGLSFLNLGPAEVSWGRMLQWAFEHAALTRGAWWVVIPPGLCITLLCLSFVFIGYTLDRVLNPRLRER